MSYCDIVYLEYPIMDFVGENITKSKEENLYLKKSWEKYCKLRCETKKISFFLLFWQFNGPVIARIFFLFTVIWDYPTAKNCFTSFADLDVQI